MARSDRIIFLGGWEQHGQYGARPAGLSRVMVLLRPPPVPNWLSRDGEPGELENSPALKLKRLRQFQAYVARNWP